MTTSNREFLGGTNRNDRMIVGVFAYREKAEAAVSELQAAGFSNSQIGVVARNSDASWNTYLDTTRTTATPGSTADHVAEGTLAGATAGAGLGGLWAMGIAAGILPGIGPIVSGGILGSLLASAAAGAATGGFLGAMLGLGISEDEAGYYQNELNAGRTVVTVDAGSRADEARSILRAHGARSFERSSSNVGGV